MITQSWFINSSIQYYASTIYIEYNTYYMMYVCSFDVKLKILTEFYFFLTFRIRI